MPRPFNQLQVLLDHARQLTQGSCIEAIACTDPNRGSEPELCLAPLASCVNMYRLARAPLV
ncbi:MAG: hypothetical protein AD742_19745 [Methylibium sp. NZG]|nr:MAG: hypothetical protein AD742_19745 [Methylibium sp. NZG]